MAFHIRDPETDRLVRELAQREGIGLTEAVREAVSKALQDEPTVSLWDQTAALRDEVATWPNTGLKADKNFYDSLSDEGTV